MPDRHTPFVVGKLGGFPEAPPRPEPWRLGDGEFSERESFLAVERNLHAMPTVNEPGRSGTHPRDSLGRSWPSLLWVIPTAIVTAIVVGAIGWWVIL